MSNPIDSQQNRFVILFHKVEGYDMPGRANHWDLMLEENGVLLTWELPSLPQSGIQMAVKKIQDHRLEYLEYEGEISGNRGTVSRVAKGSLKWNKRNRRQIECELTGDLTGRLSLSEMLSAIQPDDGKEDQWQLMFKESESYNICEKGKSDSDDA